MARVDELLAGMLARERRTQELLAALLVVSEDEDSSDDEDQLEEMTWDVQDMYDRVCALEARLTDVETRLDEAESAEQQQQSVGAACVVLCDIESSRIEIGVATAAAAEAMVFVRAVTAELTAAAAVVWWGSEEKVAMMKDVGWHVDWMREWEAMVRWCGGGRWRRLLLIE